MFSSVINCAKCQPAYSVVIMAPGKMALIKYFSLFYCVITNKIVQFQIEINMAVLLSDCSIRVSQFFDWSIVGPGMMVYIVPPQACHGNNINHNMVNLYTATLQSLMQYVDTRGRTNQRTDVASLYVTHTTIHNRKPQQGTKK